MRMPPPLSTSKKWLARIGQPVRTGASLIELLTFVGCDPILRTVSSNNLTTKCDTDRIICTRSAVSGHKQQILPERGHLFFFPPRRGLHHNGGGCKSTISPWHLRVVWTNRPCASAAPCSGHWKKNNSSQSSPMFRWRNAWLENNTNTPLCSCSKMLGCVGCDRRWIICSFVAIIDCASDTKRKQKTPLSIVFSAMQWNSTNECVRWSHTCAAVEIVSCVVCDYLVPIRKQSLLDQLRGTTTVEGRRCDYFRFRAIDVVCREWCFFHRLDRSGGHY